MLADVIEPFFITMPWTAIAVTAPTQEAANEVCSTLPSALQESTVLLAVPDATSLKVGSGAATLNALLTVAEELSARAGFSTLSAEPLRDARVLVLHSGASARGGSPNPCLPQALTSLPTVGTVPGEAEAVSMAEWAVRTASRLFHGMPPGLVVCSTDSLLLLPSAVALQPEVLLTVAGAIVAVPQSLEVALEHGVCAAATTGSDLLGSIVYRGSREQLATLASPDGTYPVRQGAVTAQGRVLAQGAARRDVLRGLTSFPCPPSLPCGAGLLGSALAEPRHHRAAARAAYQAAPRRMHLRGH